MATLVAALRGDSADLRYAGGSATGTKLNSAFVTVTANATPLSGSFIDLTDTTHVKALIFNGRLNTSNTRSMSVLLRFAPNYSGAPAARRMLWSFSVGAGNSSAYLELFHEVTTGNLFIIGKNEAGIATFSTINLGTWNTNVSGTYYDFLFQWDGTTTANAGKLYIDNVLLGAGATSTNALLAGWDNSYWKSFMLGLGANGAASAMKVDEFVIWDGAQDPANCALVSGNGALNGASRISLVNAAAFVGGTYSDPGIANVRNTASYTYAGTVETGTAAIPLAANVRSGTATDATTGILDLPATTDVKVGVIYDNTTKTGTYVAPAGGSFVFGG